MSLVSSHWFDFVTLVVLIVGFKVGQHKETLPQLVSLARWVLALFLTLFLYKAPALWLAKKFSQQPDVMALILFPLEFLIVFFLLGFVWRRIRNNISEKEPFGKWEPHLTKMMGAFRFLVFMLIAMAWISGRYVTEQDIRDHEAFCKENFGNITYPVLCTVNDDIFNGSYTGKFSKKYLSGLLMTPLPRIDYGEKPVVAGNVKTRKVKLRELDEQFEKEELPNSGANKEGKEVEEGDANVETTGGDKPSNNAPAGQIVYNDITLKGVSGSGDRLFALINDQTFRAGELSSIRFEERKLSVQCLKILESSVIIRLENNPDPIELKLGVAVDDKGELLVKTE